MQLHAFQMKKKITPYLGERCLTGEGSSLSPKRITVLFIILYILLI